MSKFDFRAGVREHSLFTRDRHTVRRGHHHPGDLILYNQLNQMPWGGRNNTSTVTLTQPLVFQPLLFSLQQINYSGPHTPYIILHDKSVLLHRRYETAIVLRTETKWRSMFSGTSYTRRMI